MMARIEILDGWLCLAVKMTDGRCAVVPLDFGLDAALDAVPAWLGLSIGDNIARFGPPRSSARWGRA